MGIIFVGSTDVLSKQHTSRFLEPFLRWWIPGITEESITLAQMIIRKLGHVTEYAVLAIFAWMALRRQASCSWLYWSRRHAWQAWLVASLYAVSDEVHQRFESTRAGSAVDVGIDAVGAAAGLAAMWCVTRLWESRRLRRKSQQAPAPTTRSTERVAV